MPDAEKKPNMLHYLLHRDCKFDVNLAVFLQGRNLFYWDVVLILKWYLFHDIIFIYMNAMLRNIEKTGEISC